MCGLSLIGQAPCLLTLPSYFDSGLPCVLTHVGYCPHFSVTHESKYGEDLE